MHLNVRVLTAAAVILCVTAAAPAQEKKPQTGTVSGRISFKGKPLTGGTITFTPSKGTAVTAAIKADGSYAALKVPAGAARVTIKTESVKPKPTKVVRPGAPKYVAIPRKYSDAKPSVITFVVKEGNQEHNVELQ